MKRAIFPGSFDPFTIGHESIVLRALEVFDEVIIAIGYNSNKPGFFPIGQRIKWISDVFENHPKVKVDSYQMLTIDYCKSKDAFFILRGLRTSADFEYERAIAQVNKTLASEIESVFLLTLPEHSMITSSIVRDIIRHGGDTSQLIPNRMKINPGDYSFKESNF